ncbi:MAG: undecaprenyl-diphosphate phosphatase [Gammaproteobacteria bacterium]|nr:undecaprenyl-diphosphate phosphatase [Gammaproteobacteria bacterium]NNF60968.1 undecaprenyl-diphosphate phosphatase [Gammaproteobacteria bacterium]NNM21256.1 undecaprenyl-diphosphate phosphatase [Gammaproteobacteria bacterium]
MDWLEPLILGIVQGLTEFFPVSSSGHLVMMQELLDFQPGGGLVFEVAVHVATLVAILIFYRRPVAQIAAGAITGKAYALRYVGKLVVGTLPTVATALLARSLIESTFDMPIVTGYMLLITGAIVWSTRYTTNRGRNLEPTWTGALLIGCAQALAILPGISRSGSTVAAAMALGMAPAAAAEFSFLLGVIAMAGAAVLLLPEISQADTALASSIAIGSIGALLSGLAALSAFVWMLKTQRFYIFAGYAWLAGMTFIAWLLWL